MSALKVDRILEAPKGTVVKNVNSYYWKDLVALKLRLSTPTSDGKTRNFQV